MPDFMDVHTGMIGLTPADLAAAHQADLAIQDEERVCFTHAWADPVTGTVFCLSQAPDADAIQRVHQRAGHPAGHVYAVPVQA
jgi:hypothetical protein